MIKPWAPCSYNRFSKWPPYISEQTALRLTAFSRTHLNMLASTVVTGLKYCYRDYINVLLQVSPKENNSWEVGPVRGALQSSSSTSILGISHSTTALHFLHSALELHLAENTASTSQLKSRCR
jgi:hypothetical protein